ncbi:Caudovirales tail fiber assembly protein [compost metagenome]
MQNIQNFKVVTPSKKLLKAYKSESGEVPLFLKSESGLDWYECQSLFADDTVKIQYDSEGIIRAVVDKPIPARGNVYAVSMLFPADASVAEVAIEDYPVDCSIDGTWKFEDGRVVRAADVVDTNTARLNTGKRDALARKATSAVAMLQASAAIGRAREGDPDALMSLFVYLDQLRDIDPSQSVQVWPPVPAILQ